MLNILCVNIGGVMKFFILLLIMFLVFSCEDEKCTENSCNKWEICKPSGRCEINPLMCSKDSDCEDNKICSSNNFCIVPCVDDEKRCKTEIIEVCKDREWKVLETCSSPKICGENFECEEPSHCLGLEFDQIEHLGGYPNTYESKNGDYMLSIGFYNKPSPIGEYDLASDLNNNYKTCNQCVLVYRYDSEGKTILKNFYPTKGILELYETSDAKLGKSKGEVRDIELTEVAIDKMTSETTIIENGECIIIKKGTKWIWNTL